MRTLPAELDTWRVKLEGWAREYGLDPFTTVFEILDYREMNEVAAYGGFPTRYPHWRFGMEFDRLAKGYTFGLSKIYEMVINNDPCYAYLLEANSTLDNKLVMAHVFAHSDFFRHNVWFARTNRKMMDEIANHGTRVRRYVDKYGLDKVEGFLDTALSVENLVDVFSSFREEERPRSEGPLERDPDHSVPRIEAKNYMNAFINPPEFLEAQRRRLEREREREKRFPESPQKDVLKFLVEHSPIESWQRDVLSIVREEALYFAPQRQTKILNEGWATYWHSRIMTEKALESSELIDYADTHSGTLGRRPGVLNPYKVGLELLRDVEDRWNKGKFGKEWEECEDMAAKKSWDLGIGEGQRKLFEVRSLMNDVTFIDTFLTEEFCEEQKLFTYEFNYRSGNYEIASRDFARIKEKLLFSLTNFGDPYVTVVDGNFRNRGELLLHHRFEGVELRYDWAVDTLSAIRKIWQRPVSLETVVDGKGKLLTHDGREVKEQTLEAPRVEG